MAWQPHQDLILWKTWNHLQRINVYHKVQVSFHVDDYQYYYSYILIIPTFIEIFSIRENKIFDNNRTLIQCF